MMGSSCGETVRGAHLFNLDKLSECTWADLS